MAEKAPGSIKELLKYVVEANAALKKEMYNANASLKKELDDVVEGMNNINLTFEELRKTKEELDSLKKEHNALKVEKEELERYVIQMETEMTQLKQFTRKKNIEIKGMPQEPKESLTEIVQAIAEKVEVQLEPSDIDVVHSVPTKEPAKTNIIVRIVSISARNKLLQAAKKKRLTTSDFGFADDSQVYINEHLCPEYKALLGEAIAKK
ncbi:hypothetical protein HPB48_016377 [Haemaphysalis longicornis]|uniref:FP protein N-terminal domain-containing protein n=1 Tax=Haemaphysalis longicornis TaxID=44386 RepID=A0A9J6GII9_HAELO|nr:hypothetical protein HPB48_016377 [Haemaphysalis longicornis]